MSCRSTAVSRLALATAALATLAISATAAADRYANATELFKNAGASAAFFDHAYGYAIFPTVGRGGFIIGGAYGEGQVFVGGNPVGQTTLTQISVGLLAGGQAYSEIIFFQDERAFREFTRGSFEFSGRANATVITANAQAGMGTTGATAVASGGRRDAVTSGGYYRGFAVFIITTGGLMLEASLGGQKFSYTPLAQNPATSESVGR